MLVLVEGLHADRGTGHVVGDGEGRTHGPHVAEAGGDDDVLEHAVAARVELPDVGHRPGDVAADADVVGVADAVDRHRERLPRHRSADRLAVGTENGEHALRLGIEPVAQHDGGVGERQPLDVAERVGAVDARRLGHAVAIVVDEVGDRHHVAIGDGDVVAGDERAVDQDLVVGAQVGELGGVEVERALVGLNLALDHQLAGVDLAGEHPVHQLGHAGDAEQLVAAAVGILAHADAHAEPEVAVDQVVAAATLDEVAARAAEDDVAGGERGLAGAEQVIHQLSQSVDQVEVGERAALGSRERDGGDVLVVAAQDIAARRARESLGRLEAGERRCYGERAPASRRMPAGSGPRRRRSRRPDSSPSRTRSRRGSGPSGRPCCRP